MKKILIFLDELYFLKKGVYISTYSSGSFLSSCLSEVSYMFPLGNSYLEVPKTYTTIIEKKIKVYQLPYWTSVVSFFSYYLKNSNHRKKLLQQYEEALTENEIVFIRMPSYPGILLAKLALKKNKKVVLHYAGNIGEAWKHNKYSGLKKIFAFMISKYMELEEKKLSKNKNVISLCTGNLLLDKYKKFGRSIFFIDSMIKAENLDSHNFDIHKKRFIYIGRFTEDKGIFLLLDVMKKLSKRYSDFSLDVIGFGQEEEKVKKLSAEISQVNFIGFVPNQDIYKYLNKNDIFVMPSTLSEGFPRVILEAWSQGLVVLSSNVGGIEGLGVNNNNIIFCEKNSFDDLYDKCKLILDNKIDLKGMQDYILKNRHNITLEYYKDILEHTITEI